MDLLTYYFSPVLSKSNDLTTLVTPLYNYLPELGFEGCFNNASLQPLKNQTRLELNVTHFHSDKIYYEEIVWKLQYLTFDGVPIAIFRRVAEADPYPNRFLTNEAAFKQALLFIKSLLVPEFVSPLEPLQPISGSINTVVNYTSPVQNDLSKLEAALDFKFRVLLMHT